MIIYILNVLALMCAQLQLDYSIIMFREDKGLQMHGHALQSTLPDFS